MPMVTCPVDGTEFPIAPAILARRKHPPTCSRKCRAAQMRGEGHWRWKGGRYVTANGYVRVRRPKGHPGNDDYMYEHVLVMEKKLGRRLRPNERVLHRDENRQNNAPRNLRLRRVQTSAALPRRRRAHAA